MPSARPELTLKTFELIGKRYPDLALCVSTNGLNLAAHAAALRDLGVDFVTITINAIDPRIGVKLVKSVSADGETIHGTAGAKLLIERQMSAVDTLLAQGVTVKINTVIIPGINDDHSLFIAKRFGAMGVDLMNLIPLIPVRGTEMEDVTPPSPRLMAHLRKAAGSYIPQMLHCKRCRSDALGCL
ncbi:MAG: radical SAM protein [Desulfobacterales bacterium]|nr:radical SAM protein [Desulfobacterales bacterium]